MTGRPRKSLEQNLPIVREWHKKATCRTVSDPDIFYPEVGRSSQAARSICAGCPVLMVCLEENLFEGFGVWGGTSERERRKLRQLVEKEGLSLAEALVRVRRSIKEVA